MPIQSVIGKEISYTRAIVSAMPFVGLFVLVFNSAASNKRDNEICNSNMEIGRKKLEHIRSLQVGITYAKLAIASAIATIIIFVLIATAGKTPSRPAAALAGVPVITIAFAGYLWGVNKKTIAMLEKKDDPTYLQQMDASVRSLEKPSPSEQMQTGLHRVEKK